MRDMPRLSVDIEVVYRPLGTSGAEALAAIAGEFDAIAGRRGNRGMRTRQVAANDLDDTKPTYLHAAALRDIRLALRQIAITGGAVESSRPARRARWVSNVAKSSQPAASAW